MKFLLILPALIAVTYASLASDVKPVLGAVNPLAQGLDDGLQQGAGNVKATVQNLGAAGAQAANGLADIIANLLAGLGQTVGQVPGRGLQTVRALEHGGGPLSSVLNTAFG